jgi:hypothetical protein
MTPLGIESNAAVAGGGRAAAEGLGDLGVSHLSVDGIAGAVGYGAAHVAAGLPRLAPMHVLGQAGVGGLDRLRDGRVGAAVPLDAVVALKKELADGRRGRNTYRRSSTTRRNRAGGGVVLFAHDLARDLASLQWGIHRVRVRGGRGRDRQDHRDDDELHGCGWRELLASIWYSGR